MARIANDNPVEQDGTITDNIIQPFQLQESGLRGRAVRMGSVLDEILSAHSYPLPIALLVADMVTLATALSSMLKYDGIFTLQASGKGIVKTIVADIQDNGALRGCATYDSDMLQSLEKTDGIYDGLSLLDLTGEGYLAFTVDQGGDMERYQGIVSLQGATFCESIAHYFEQSEQLRTSLYVASRYDEDGHWRSGALMLQYLPDDNHSKSGDIIAFNEKSETERKEDWLRSKTLLQTCTDDEILNKDLHVHELLRRLFHEEGVVVYDAKSLRHECRCSIDKVRAVIDTLPEEDKIHAEKDGKIEMTCEFCSKTYTIEV